MINIYQVKKKNHFRYNLSDQKPVQEQADWDNTLANHTGLIMKFIQILLFLILPISSVIAHENETLYNVVNIDASAEKEIPNDQMTVVLVSQHEGRSASEVSKQVNQEIGWALALVKLSTFIDTKTTNYQTYPIYNKQDITGWRTSQQLELKSTNVEGLSEAVGKLQEKLKIQQMYFGPTDATRKQYENQLIEEAMEAFKERVSIVGKHMENKDHRIINININSGGYNPPMLYQSRVMEKTMAMDSAPSVEAGTSKVTVTVNGSVQFF